MAAIVLEVGVDEFEVVEHDAFAGLLARGVALAGEVGGGELNPNGKLVLVGDELDVLEAQVADVGRAAVADGHRRRIGIVDEVLDHHIFDGGAPATVEGEGIVHGHGEAILDEDVLAVAGEIEGVVVILLLAVDDFDVDGGEVFGVGDGGGPVGGAEQEQALEGNVLAVIDDVALDAGAMGIVDQALLGARFAVAGIGLEVVPEPGVALHVDGAAAGDGGVLNVVEDEEGAERALAGRHWRRAVVGGVTRPANEGARIDVEFDVALHQHSAGEIDPGGKEEHAAAGPSGDIGDGLVNGRGLQRFAGVVDLVVHDVDDVGIAQLGRVLLLGLGEQQQAGTLEGGLFVEEDDQ